MKTAPFPPSFKRQTGVAAIEFALAFPLFLIIFYGIVCYSLILLDKQALSAISTAAARNAVAVSDPDLIPTQIQQAIDGHSWITERLVKCTDWSGFYAPIQSDGQLHICLQAKPVNLPRLDLLIFQLPPDNLDEMLRSTATVLWEP